MLPTKSHVLSNNCENVYAGLVSNWCAALVFVEGCLEDNCAHVHSCACGWLVALGR